MDYTHEEHDQSDYDDNNDRVGKFPEANEEIDSDEVIIVADNDYIFRMVTNNRKNSSQAALKQNDTQY